ncbi:hypothetical protein N9W79_01440 [bacterium]|nr:hypothetical protein [bacterium]
MYKLFGIFLFISLLSVQESDARPKYFSNFNKLYQTKSENFDKLNKFKCGICHINPRGRGTRTPYGEDFRANRRDLLKIEALDSDKDGISNLNELIAGTNPGDSNSK